MKKHLKIFAMGFVSFGILVSTNVSANAADAANRTNQPANGGYQKRTSFDAERSGTNANVYFVKGDKEVSYTLYVGQMVNRAAGEAFPPALYNDLSLNMIYFGPAGNPTALALFYKPSNKIEITDKKWIYKYTLNGIGDTNQMVFLVANTPSGKTYDFRPIINRDGSLAGRVLKGACSLSAWGDPIARGTLAFTNLALTGISYLPGGQLAGAGSFIISSVSMATATEPASNLKELIGQTYNSEEYVRGYINLDISQKAFNDAKLGVGKSMKIALNNGISTPVNFTKISKVIPTAKGVNITLDYVASVKTTRELFDVVKGASASSQSTNQLCAALN